MHACMASGRTDPACCSSLSFQNARIKSIFSSKASAASSASAMATGHKDLHRPTHTNGHVAQYGGDQDAMDERCDDGDNQSRARRRRGRWQRRRESPRWSKSRAALFSLANGQVTATVTAGFLRKSNCHALSHPFVYFVQLVYLQLDSISSFHLHTTLPPRLHTSAQHPHASPSLL